MNTTRRVRISKTIASLEAVSIVERLEGIRDSIQFIVDDEQFCLDELPENLQESDQANKMQEAVDNLEDALNEIDNIEECVNASIEQLTEAKG